MLAECKRWTIVLSNIEINNLLLARGREEIVLGQNLNLGIRINLGSITEGVGLPRNDILDTINFVLLHIPMLRISLRWYLRTHLVRLPLEREPVAIHGFSRNPTFKSFYVLFKVFLNLTIIYLILLSLFLYYKLSHFLLFFLILTRCYKWRLTYHLPFLLFQIWLRFEEVGNVELLRLRYIYLNVSVKTLK